MVTRARLQSILFGLLKWFGIAFATLLLLFSIISWVIVKKKNAWLLQEIQAYASQSQSGQLKIRAIDLKLFKNLPYVTLELDGVDYFEHRDSLRQLDEKPILHADQLFVAVELVPLMNEELNVAKIGLSGAQLNIIEYHDGLLNIDKALSAPSAPPPPVVVKDTVPQPKPIPIPLPAPKPAPVLPQPKAKPDSVEHVKTESPPKTALKVELDLINIDETLISWKSYGSPGLSVFFIEELEVNLARGEKAIMAKFTSACEVRSAFLNKSSLPSGDLTLIANLSYEPSSQVLTIDDGKVAYKLFTATIQGSYEHTKKRRLELNVDASSNALRMLSLVIKPELIKQNPNLLERGELYVKGKVFGELETQPPQVDVFFGVRNLTLRFPAGKFENVDVDGRFVTGSAPDFSQAKFDIKKLNGQLPGGFLKGEFHLANFVEPHVRYDLNAQLKLDGFDQIFQIDFIKQLSGTISVQANFNGPLKAFAEHGMDSSRSSTITMDSVSFLVAQTSQAVTGLSGKITNKNNQAAIEQLAFHYGKNDVQLKATIDNLVYLLVKGERNIVAAGKLTANQLYTKDFIADTLLSAEVQDRMSNVSFGFKITTKTDTSGVMPVISFEIDSLSASLDKLPDIKMLNTAGTFRQTSQGLKLDLSEFHAILPQGKVDVAGDLLVRTRTLWEFNAKVKTDKFPWTYITELAAEIREGAEPRAKNLPVSAMELATVDLDLSASLTTYPFDINKLEIRNSRGSLTVPGSKPISADKINVALENLLFKHPENSGELIGMKSTKGTVELIQFTAAGLNAMDVKTSVSGEEDRLTVEFSGVTQRALSQKGEFVLDFSKKELEYHLKYLVKGANLEYFMQRFYKKKFMDGTIDYSLDIHTQGSTWAQAKQGLSGEIEISGDSLRLYGVDIDDVLRRYKNSQNFNLTDVGAVLIAGPIGLAVTKGSDFVSLATINFNGHQKTNIKTLVTKWKLENLQLTARDVAFATMTNRVAFDGQIDFGRDSIPGITISVVDKNGCSLMDQKLYGKMGKLQTGKLNITKTLLGSVINFANAVVGKDCKPVYTGTVKDPASVP